MLTLFITTLATQSLIYVSLVLTVAWGIKSWLSRSKYNLPPFPEKPYPFLGNLPHLKVEPRETMMKWKGKCGDVFSLYMGTTLVVVFTSYALLKETLIKQADIFTHRPRSFFAAATQDGTKGVLNSSGANWKEQRSVTMVILRSFGMGKNSLALRIQEEIGAYLSELSHLKGQASDLRTLTNASVANIICSIIVGRRYEYNDPYFTKFLDIFNDQVRLLSGTSLLRWFPWLRYIPGDMFQAKRVISNNDQVLRYFSDRYIKESDQVYDDENVNFIAAYLKELKKKQDNGEDTTMNVGNLRRVIGDLFIAGSETTSSTILWFLLFMIHYPDVQRKVYKEIEEVIGTERLPSVQDKSKLNYLNATIMETQRRASILPFSLNHLCTADTNVRGYTIPKGTVIWPHLDAVLWDEKTWGDPMNFRPKRFLDAKGNLLHPEEFTPFSLGRRICLGESLAKMELFLFLSAIVQRFEVVPVHPDHLPLCKGIFGITSAPLPYEVKLIERRAA